MAYTYPYGTNGNRLSGWKITSGGTLTGKLDVAGSSTETIGTNAYLGQLYVSNAAARTPEVNTTNFIAYQAPVLSGTQQVVAAIGDVAGNAGYDTNTVVLKVVTNATYSYSTAGCITGISYAGTVGYTKTVSLSWNGLYQLTSVTTNGAAAETYQYDALGRRTRIAAGSTTNYLVYDGPHVIAEVNASGVLQKSYTYGPGIDNLLAFTTGYGTASTNTYYLITDHLGTVHAAVDSSGSIVESYRYDAWGKVLGVYDSNDKPMSESAIGNRVLWQGREYSWKTGLYFFRARWYDPVTGRWLSKDPIGISGGLNQYVFCDNNPVNYRDPFGLCGDGDKVLKDIRDFYDAIDQVVEDTIWPRWFVERMALFSLSGGPWGPLDFKYQAAQGKGPFTYSLNGGTVTADYLGNYVAGYQAGYGGDEGLLEGVYLGGQLYAGAPGDEPAGDAESVPAISAGYVAGQEARRRKLGGR